MRTPNVYFKALTWTWMIGVGFVVTSLTTLFALLC